MTNVLRLCGDSPKSITEIDLKELDRDICRRETVSFHALSRGCQCFCNIVFPVEIDTSNATDMGHVFNRCNNLSTLDLSTFNTDNVTNMESMFDGCSSHGNVKCAENDKNIERSLPRKCVR